MVGSVLEVMSTVREEATGRALGELRHLWDGFLHPEQTGIRYIECVGIIPIESRTILTNRISRDIPQQVKQMSLSGRSVCPACKKLMAINVKHFCDNCGQAIKWE